MKLIRKYGNQYVTDPMLISYIREDRMEEMQRSTCLADMFHNMSQDIEPNKVYAFNITEHKDTSLAGLVITKFLLMLYEEDV